MGSGPISLPLIAASDPRDEGTGCPELVSHGRSSGWLSVFAIRTTTGGNIPAAASVHTAHPGSLSRRSRGWFLYLPILQRSKVDSVLTPCFFRQRTACYCRPCSRPCPSWTCTGRLDWSSTSRCLTSCGTNCWSACQPSLQRGRRRKGGWAADECSCLLSVGTEVAAPLSPWLHIPA